MRLLVLTFFLSLELGIGVSLPAESLALTWVVPSDGVWEVDGNVVTGGSEGEVVEHPAEARESDGAQINSMLVSANRWSDFTFTAAFRIDPETNSGVFIRCADPEQISPMSCYEINIWDNHPKAPSRTGAIVGQVEPPLEHVESLGKWNTLEICALGGVVIVRMNGELTAKLEGATKREGHIALQRFVSGVVEFRDLELQRLESDARGCT